MTELPRPHLSRLSELVARSMSRPVPDFIQEALGCAQEMLDANAVLLTRSEDGLSVVVGASADPELRLSGGAALPLTEAGLRQRLKAGLAITPVLDGGKPPMTLVAARDQDRAFTGDERALLELFAALIGSRLNTGVGAAAAQRPRPLSTQRLASHEVREPLTILRGYADMLGRNEIPAAQLPTVARSLADQSETVVRVVDQVLILSRLPLELAFSVRVLLSSVAQSAAKRARASLETAGIALRLQMDADGEVWGDAVLLEAAVDEMINNVLKHAATATTLQLRLRQPAADRFQLLVKDDGPGMSAERLADLFAPESHEFPDPGQGIGLHLVRRVAAAHGGTAWANSLEGKGTTFYLELPAASPDGTSARASQAAQSA